MEINNPLVLTEVSDKFARYEKALVDRDLSVMRELFWDSKYTLRYGVADEQHGITELTAWREAQAGLPEGRSLQDTEIVTFGDAFAVVNTVFTYPGEARRGRQSQTWVRIGGDWRIVSAHVSQI